MLKASGGGEYDVRTSLANAPLRADSEDNAPGLSQIALRYCIALYTELRITPYSPHPLPSPTPPKTLTPLNPEAFKP